MRVAPMQMKTSFRNYVYSLIAAEISAVTRYADRVIQWLPTRNDDFLLLDMVDSLSKSTLSDEELSTSPMSMTERRLS